MERANRLKAFLKGVDYRELSKPTPAGEPNREQARFMKWLTDEYGISEGVSVQAGIYQLLYSVVGDIETEWGE